MASVDASCEDAEAHKTDSKHVTDEALNGTKAISSGVSGTSQSCDDTKNETDKTTLVSDRSNKKSLNSPKHDDSELQNEISSVDASKSDTSAVSCANTDKSSEGIANGKQNKRPSVVSSEEKCENKLRDQDTNIRSIEQSDMTSTVTSNSIAKVETKIDSTTATSVKQSENIANVKSKTSQRKSTTGKQSIVLKDTKPCKTKVLHKDKKVKATKVTHKKESRSPRTAEKRDKPKSSALKKSKNVEIKQNDETIKDEKESETKRKSLPKNKVRKTTYDKKDKKPEDKLEKSGRKVIDKKTKRAMKKIPKVEKTKVEKPIQKKERQSKREKVEKPVRTMKSRKRRSESPRAIKGNSKDKVSKNTSSSENIDTDKKVGVKSKVAKKVVKPKTKKEKTKAPKKLLDRIQGHVSDENEKSKHKNVQNEAGIHKNTKYVEKDVCEGNPEQCLKRESDEQHTIKESASTVLQCEKTVIEMPTQNVEVNKQVTNCLTKTTMNETGNTTDVVSDGEDTDIDTDGTLELKETVCETSNATSTIHKNEDDVIKEQSEEAPTKCNKDVETSSSVKTAHGEQISKKVADKAKVSTMNKSDDNTTVTNDMDLVREHMMEVINEVATMGVAKGKQSDSLCSSAMPSDNGVTKPTKKVDVYDYEEETDAIIPPKRTKFKVDGKVKPVTNKTYGGMRSVSTESTDSDSYSYNEVHNSSIPPFFSCERSEVVNHVDTSGLPDVEVILAGTALKEDVPTTNKTEGSFKCIRCEFRSKRKVLTRKHQFSHNIFQCLYCDDLFETFLKFESHGKIMHPKKPGLQTCSKCGFCIRLGETYQQHMNDCEGRQSVVCQHCGKGFKYEFRLKTHIQKQHSGVEGVLPQYPCEKCDFQAETRGALLRHELTHLDYACKHCSERFTSKASLREHLKIHADAKPYVCSECGRGFKCEFRLKDHKGCHSSERPFTCNIDDCILTFRTSAQCERHRRDVHNLRERPLVCEFGCGQRFYNTASLKRHQNTHHRSDQYFCEWEGCGKVFLHPDNLRVHSMQHTNEKPFSCELCDFTCRQKTSWQWHMTKKHPGEEYKSVPKRRVGIVKAMPQNSLVNMPPTTDSDKMSDHCNTNKSWMADGDPALPAQDDRDKLSIQSLDTAPAGCADTALVDDDATTADVNKAIDQVLAEQMADPIDDLNHLQAAEASEVFNNQDPGVLESPLSGDETSEVHVRPGTNDIDSPTTTMAMSYNNGNDSSRHSSFSNPTNALPDANVSKPEELATFGDENLTKTVPGTYPSSVGGHMESGYMDSQHQNCYSNTFSQMLPPQNNTILTPSTGQVHPDPSTLDSAVCDPIKALERISNSTVSSYKSHHMDMPYPKPNIESNYIKTDMEQSYMKPSMDNSSYPGTPVVSNPPAIPPYNSSEPVMTHPQYPPSVTVPTDPYAPHGDMAAYPTAPPSMMSHHYSHDTTNQQSLEGNTIKQHMISPHDASSNVSHPLVSPTTGNLDQRRNSTVSQEGPDNMYDIPPASNNSTKVSSVQSDHQSFDVPPPGVLPPSTAPPSAPPLTSAPLGVLPPSVLTSTTDPNTTTGHFSTTGTQSGGQVPAMGPAGAGPRSVGPPSVAPPSVDPPSAAPPNVGPPSAGPPNVAPPSAALPSVGPSSAGPPSVGPPSAGPPSVAPPSVGHPSAAPPSVAPPSVGPPTVAPPSVGPPSVAPPSVGPPSVAPPSVGPPSVAPPSVGPPSVAPPSVGPPSVAPPSVPPPSNVSTQEQSTYDMPPSNAISIDAPPTANSIQIVPQPDQASVDSGLATGDDNTPRTDTTVSSELVVPVSASKIDTFSSNTEISSLTDSSGYPNFYPSHMPSTGEPNMPSTNCFDSMLAHPSTTSSWQSATAGTITEKPVDNGAAVEESAEKQSEGGTLIPSTSLDNTTVPPTLLAGTGYMPPDHSASLPDAPSYMGYSHPQDPLSGRSLDTYRSADYLRRGYPGSEILNSAGSQTGLGQQAWMGGSYSGALSQPPILPPSTDLSSSLSKEGYTSKEGYLTTPNSKDPSFLYDKDYSKRMGSGFPMPGREGMSMFNDPMSNPYGLTDWGRYSAGPNPPYARLPATSGKSYEDPYYRSLQPPAAPDVLSRMSMGPLGLDKYYYPRESMYRSNIMAPAGNPFMAQTPNPSADYRTQSMYSQQYPFMGSASHKFPQGVPPLPDRPMGSEYYGAPPPAPSTQDSRQDPYSRSMFYHMMNRF